MDNYAVIGNPIAHSRSPTIHHMFAEQLSHEITYKKIEADEKSFEEQVESFFTRGGKGLNVTLPFKKQAFSMSDNLSNNAKECGAVNTLSFSEDGRISGESTDGNGLIEDLKSNEVLIKDKSILIIGSGGTAQSIIPQLVANSARQLSLSNRTMANAISLKEQYIHLLDIACLEGELINRNFDIVINTTSAHLEGTLPVINPVAIQNSVCYDVNYSYGETIFQKWSAENGAKKSLQGWGMLVEQAAESFYIWRGIRPKTREIISRLSSEPEN